MDELKDSIKVPLTEVEVFFVTKSWKTIRRNMVNIGVAMFLRFDIHLNCGVHHLVVAPSLSRTFFFSLRRYTDMGYLI